jgi:hypothetical protein
VDVLLLVDANTDEETGGDIVAEAAVADVEIAGIAVLTFGGVLVWKDATPDDVSDIAVSIDWVVEVDEEDAEDAEDEVDKEEAFTLTDATLDNKKASVGDGDGASAEETSIEEDDSVSDVDAITEKSPPAPGIVPWSELLPT